ncbi:MAG: IclR family transcriptional regulator, partial [Anaerovoracaceae bacterium]
MSDDKGVQSVERALDIIESAASRQEGKSLTEISADTGLHKSTAYRIINTLVRRGFLMREDDGNYKLGHKLIETASYYINELELQTEARPYVAEISVHLGLAAYLGVLEGENVIYLEKINGPFTLKDFSQT